MKHSHYHVSVLLQDVLDYLKPRSGGVYIDATLGGGGHSLEILKQGGQVLAIDQDQDAIDHIKNELKIDNAKLTIVHDNFAHIGEIARQNGLGPPSGGVDGILFDLGISSHHVDTAERGFSFLKEGPLDMRMDMSGQVTAADLVNGLTERELSELFTRYGEEPFAKRIAKAIVQERKNGPIFKTTQLAEVIRRVIPGHTAVHPATKVFQALRIAVNDELHVIDSALVQSIELLRPGGRLVVISFHSLEDRIVKQTFSTYEKKGIGKQVLKKPLVPSEKEQEVNNRSRSAKLRVFEKI